MLPDNPSTLQILAAIRDLENTPPDTDGYTPQLILAADEAEALSLSAANPRNIYFW